MCQSMRVVVLFVLALLAGCVPAEQSRVYRQTVWQRDSCNFPPRLARSLTSIVVAVKVYEVSPSKERAAALRAAIAQLGIAVDRLLTEVPPE